MSNDIANANAPVTVDVVLAQDKYEELLESHHLMVFLNDPKSKVTLTRSKFNYYLCEYTDPLTEANGGIEFGDSPKEALEKALHVIKRRRGYRERQESAA